ncbi:MAG: hypothetical protein WDN28_25460 [Chthoniobacter sp.]
MERSISNSAIYSSVSAWRDHSRYEYLSILGLLAALGAIVGCLKTGPGRSWRIFGAVWFALAFLPISNLFPLNAEVAEHWIYLASIGFLIFLAESSLRFRRGRTMAAWISVVAIAGLGMRTAVRSGDWIDAETFCARTIARWRSDSAHPQRARLDLRATRRLPPAGTGPPPHHRAVPGIRSRPDEPGYLPFPPGPRH